MGWRSDLKCTHLQGPEPDVSIDAGSDHLAHFPGSSGSGRDALQPFGFDAAKRAGLRRAGQLGLKGNATGFPQITGLSSTQGGFLFTNSSGGTTSTIGPTNAGVYHNDKPDCGGERDLGCGGNHTYKTGAEWRRDLWTDVET